MDKKNAQVVLRSRPGPTSVPTFDNFLYRECPFPSDPLQNGEVLVKALYLSVDPTLRFAMNEENVPSYLRPWEINETVEGIGGVGIVEASNSSKFQIGDYVNGITKWPWQLYFVQHETRLIKVRESIPRDKITLSLSLYGSSGLTSLIGIWEKGHIVPGSNQTFVVSGAAGSCGYLAGQIARLEGCGKVVGICGSDDKCKVIIDAGFDEAINYKTENVEERLKVACPNGIDIYFDNVGGAISDTVIKQMNRNGHVILCGQISQYDRGISVPFPELDLTILTERNISRDPFLVLMHRDQFPKAIDQLIKWFSEGKLQVKEDFEEGLANAGKAFLKMMQGGNIGKQLVNVADP